MIKRWYSIFGIKNSSGEVIDPSTIGSIPGLEIAAGNVEGRSNRLFRGITFGVSNVFKDIWIGTILSELIYDAQTANFTPGLVLTGGTSGATAIIVLDIDNGTSGTLTIRKVSGAFINNETITDSSTGSATSDGVDAEVIAMDDPTAGETWELICESSDDDVSGIGATTIAVEYMDDSYTDQIEIVTLSGHTPSVLTSTNALRIVALTVVGVGSNQDPVYGNTNLGTIVLRDSSTKKIRAGIVYEDSVVGDEHGLSASQMARLTVPAGKTCYVMNINTNTKKNNDVFFRLLVMADGTDFFVNGGELSQYQNSFLLNNQNGPIQLPEKTDIKIIARSDNVNVFVSVFLVFILIDN